VGLPKWLGTLAGKEYFIVRFLLILFIERFIFLKHLMVYGLENTADPRAKALAFDVARKWLYNNFAAYKQSIPNSMFEKVLYFVSVLYQKNQLHFLKTSLCVVHANAQSMIRYKGMV